MVDNNGHVRIRSSRPTIYYYTRIIIRSNIISYLILARLRPYFMTIRLYDTEIHIILESRAIGEIYFVRGEKSGKVTS